MGKIISIVGNLGAGKTTLSRLLCNKGQYSPYWERPEEHPYQQDFTEDRRKWALVNQMDFFLYRCEQELIARKNDPVAVMDGGLDQDFHVFTKYLYRNGCLNQAEFSICERFYNYSRGVLPPPEIFIRIIVDLPTLMERRSSRDRKTIDQSFSSQEFGDLEKLLDEWLLCDRDSPVIQFHFSRDFRHMTTEIDELVCQIETMLPARGG